MALNMAVLLFSFSTITMAMAAFSRSDEHSFESAVVMLAVAGLAWALGSVMGYLVPAVRQLVTKAALTIRWAAVAAFALAATLWPWGVGDSCGTLLLALSFFSAGLFVPAVIGLKADAPEEMREAYEKSMIGAAIGALMGALISRFCGGNALFAITAVGVLLAPALQPGLFFSKAPGNRRWASAAFAVLVFGAIWMAPAGSEKKLDTANAAEYVGVESVFQFRPDRKFDVYVLGREAADFASQVRESTRENAIRSWTAHASNGRRKLLDESRRFDLIQVVEPASGANGAGARSAMRAEGVITVEALRLYFDRLKDDGFLQILGRQSGASAQSVLATVAEAWKKSARRDVDLHAVAVMSGAGSDFETVVVRMSAFSRDERERLGEKLQVGKQPGLATGLVSDSSGAVLTDNRPFGVSAGETGSGGRAVLWGTVVVLLGLIFWVTRQERRKELASRWQTASVATYFGGLGMSFAFFHVFFVLRAMRDWGMPDLAVGFALAAVFGSTAVGAVLLAGHPRRRYGVRIQPLANFVFATLFTYLGAALFEPLTASGSEWVSAFVGVSVLVPFGLLGGAFLPNALEEASEKLAPRVLSLLWAIYAAGTALGVYVALLVSLKNGLDVVFVTGLFCFAWVAIISGLVRPWAVRKTNS